VALLSSSQLDAVSDLIRETGERELLPLFRTEGQIDVSEKSPGELVTQADRSAEHRLAAGLQAILPASRVIGEETWGKAAPADSAVFGDTPVWVVDPLDGTGAFVDGDPMFAIMVALIQHGETLAGWIHAPVPGWMATAERGAGAFLNGNKMRTAISVKRSDMDGSVRLRFLPDGIRQQVIRAIPGFRRVAMTGSSGWDHVAVANGGRHFSLYYRTLVWDHAPGCLMISESGGVAARLDGSPYTPLVDTTGLLTACNAETWATIHDLFMDGTDYRLGVRGDPAAGRG
jgi:fructose-1,6-bisphosphatase/inositol monophosphatase family enzyme